MLDRMILGEVPPKHHVALRSESGALRNEECLTIDGFDGPYTILYREHRPHAYERVTPSRQLAPIEPVDGTLCREHLQALDVPARGGVALETFVPLLFSEALRISVARPSGPDNAYVVNGDAHTLIYVQQGGGSLRSLMGDVAFSERDYLYVPKGLLHRFELTSEQQWFVLESIHPLAVPSQWRNAVGQLKMDAPYCHRDFKRPTFVGPMDEGIRDVLVKRLGQLHALRYAHTPLDAVGWDGAVYPWAFPILNFQPRVGLVHLPPTVHGTFAMRGALVCSFVPRPVDFHPEAVPCPYPHSSVDVDEVIFYSSGEFTSRRGIDVGSVTLHPAGLPHGPHPEAYEKSIGTKTTSELAVMVDSYERLQLTSAAQSVRDAEYEASFR